MVHFVSISVEQILDCDGVDHSCLILDIPCITQSAADGVLDSS